MEPMNKRKGRKQLPLVNEHQIVVLEKLLKKKEKSYLSIKWKHKLVLPVNKFFFNFNALEDHYKSHLLYGIYAFCFCSLYLSMSPFLFKICSYVLEENWLN